MPTILAIETSSELASAALSVDGRIISREAAGVQTHSQSLLPMVQDLLGEAGLGLAQCDALAFGAGPGSFTGVRTACGVAQGLAFGLGLPLIPVVTLLAMAQACRDKSGASEVLVLLDARMEEVYCARYRYRDGWETIAEPALLLPSQVNAGSGAVACGNGLRAYARSLPEQSFAETWPDVVPHAAQVAALAEIDLRAGRTVEARDAQPVYLRNKVALTTAERLSKAAA